MRRIWEFIIGMWLWFRRVRNRDAAVRSRERKKEYVQDLEKKSKYLERECLRLGRMLDCFVAENQSLRYCLQKGNGNITSMMTKQESAVLLLESLLLGSLLWLLGVNIICLFPYLSHTKCYLLLSEPEKLVLNGLGSSSKPSNTDVSRRCKGSRPRMKHQILTLVAWQCFLTASLRIWVVDECVLVVSLGFVFWLSETYLFNIMG